MTFIYSLQSVLEIMLVAALVWGVFHERKLAAMEKIIFRKVKRYFKKRRLNKAKIKRSFEPSYYSAEKHAA